MTPNGHSYRDVYQQWVTFEKVRESKTKLRLIEKAPKFSMIGERATDVRIKLDDMQGAFRMRFWHGGTLFNKAYSDETHEFNLVRVPAPAPTPGAAGALAGSQP